jgi:uncharacterized protein
MEMTVPDLLALAEWRRRVAELYAEVRADPDPERAWLRWSSVRHDLFVHHPQSPVPPDERPSYEGPFTYPYDPAARVAGTVKELPPEPVEIGTSDGRAARFVRFAAVRFELEGRHGALEVFWLDAYGGGIYLSFRDATSGGTTYGGGRYLLDTVKGADLGADGDELVLDFNFAYQPSCSYDPRWSCPLPPPANRLAFPVAAGERVSAEQR